MSDWGRFLECVPWFVSPGAEVVVGPSSTWTRGALPGLPRLSALLASARVTPVSVAGHSYELLCWGSSGWLCEPPSEADSSYPDSLRAFWRVFGGTVEQFFGPSTWWLNQNQVLTVDAASLSFCDVVSEYGFAGEEVRDYVTVAIEANGNLTAAHCTTGRLVLFAPDHSFSGVTSLGGYLYTFDEAPDLASWIEACAGAWQAGVS
ncbi:hypothetical protein [Lentzea sp. NPDC051838]|uniref:hypothetical protein n=1 Tax=Lentzea sp. NPDC051838 TaxID=3154849 RepID=UPI00341AACF5